MVVPSKRSDPVSELLFFHLLLNGKFHFQMGENLVETFAKSKVF